MEQQLKKLIEGEQDPPGKLLMTLARDWRTLLDERMRPFGMSGARWTVLLALHTLGRPTNQTTLAKVVGVQAPTLVHMLDGLEQDDFVRRLPYSGDRRVKRVKLRPKGLRLCEKLHDVAQTMEEEILGFLPETRREGIRADLLKIRSRIQDLSGRE